MLSILENFGFTPSLQKFGGNFVVDDTIGTSLLIASIFNKNAQKILLLANNLYHAQRLANLLSSFVSPDKIILFPSDESYRYESLATSKEFLAQRLFTYGSALTNKLAIYIAHPSSILRYLPSPRLFLNSMVHIKVNETIDQNDLIKKIINSGYYRVNKIGRSLEFAKRGDIFDIFPINFDDPIRISFFDNVVESITKFNLINQESYANLNEIDIFPASDQIYNSDEFSKVKNNLLDQLNKDKENGFYTEELEQQIREDSERILTRDNSESLYKYYGFLQKDHFSFLDYLNPNFIFIANYEQFQTAIDLLNKESADFLSSLHEQRKLISHLQIFHDFNRIIKNHKYFYGANFKKNANDFVFNVRPIVGVGTNREAIFSTISNYYKNCNKLIIALANASQRNIICDILNEEKIRFSNIDQLEIPDEKIGITIYSLSNGFEIVDSKIAVLTSHELFNYNSSNARFQAQFKDAGILKSYTDLQPGDFVVHESFGIGKFLDIVSLDTSGQKRDYIFIQYAGDDKVYIPLSQFHLVRKYSGREGYIPKLNAIGSTRWKTTKERIRERLNELTERLTNLYKERAQAKGYAFPADDEIQEKFNSTFEYTLTDDQEEAYRNIRDDMEKPIPMDRLLCGDVGFGKTEVAFRAIFKCINSGKLALLLCPTTLLCRQHYELAKTRFEHFGIRIAVFSRLVSLTNQKQYIEEINKGNIHLVIGTHRLLSNSIKYPNLGLLVIDEEQRFGVEQKEKLKEIKNDVDVLCLSATPIPRTLQMSLVGMRELSLINTPPQNRSPIQTYVVAYNEILIKELIERELSRNGQIFYLHNNVGTIYTVASKIQSMIPLATVGVVHGQMDRDEIEEVMLRFYQGTVTVLVATSIIENGIDVPNANMIIVENADRFGLSQLYQIKGRVGRSDRIAYAYFLYNASKVITEEGAKRLKAIQEFTELGSGYKIAQRDLMIRGAGDILGREQAGFIDSIGIDLYIKLLNEAVKEKKENKEVKSTEKFLLSADGYIPDDYIIKDEKLNIYKELNAIENEKDIKNFVRRLKDVFGRIPKPVNELIKKREIEIILNYKEFRFVDENMNKITIYLTEQFSSQKDIGIKIFEALLDHLDYVQISYLQKELRIDFYKTEQWVEKLKNVVSKIHNLVKVF